MFPYMACFRSAFCSRAGVSEPASCRETLIRVSEPASGRGALIEEERGLQAGFLHVLCHILPAADEADLRVVKQQPLIELLAQHIRLQQFKDSQECWRGSILQNYVTPWIVCCIPTGHASLAVRPAVIASGSA